MPPDTTATTVAAGQMTLTRIYNHTGVPVGVVVLIIVAIVVVLLVGLLVGRTTALRAPTEPLDLRQPEEPHGAKVIGGRF